MFSGLPLVCVLKIGIDCMLLQDPVLKFRIACQMFVELSRDGKPIDSALGK